MLAVFKVALSSATVPLGWMFPSRFKTAASPIQIGSPTHGIGGPMSRRFPIGVSVLKWVFVNSILAGWVLILAILGGSRTPAHAMPIPRVKAIPAFARKYGLPCSACHTAWPELNNFGQVFRDNGYQLMNDRDSPIWQNPSYFPISFRITPVWHRESTKQSGRGFHSGRWCGLDHGVRQSDPGGIRFIGHGPVVRRNPLQEHFVCVAAVVGSDGGVCAFIKKTGQQCSRPPSKKLTVTIAIIVTIYIQ